MITVTVARKSLIVAAPSSGLISPDSTLAKRPSARELDTLRVARALTRVFAWRAARFGKLEARVKSGIPRNAPPSRTVAAGHATRMRVGGKGWPKFAVTIRR